MSFPPGTSWYIEPGDPKRLKRRGEVVRDRVFCELRRATVVVFESRSCTDIDADLGNESLLRCLAGALAFASLVVNGTAPAPAPGPEGSSGDFLRGVGCACVDGDDDVEAREVGKYACKMLFSYRGGWFEFWEEGSLFDLAFGGPAADSGGLVARTWRG